MLRRGLRFLSICSQSLQDRDVSVALEMHLGMCKWWWKTRDITLCHRTGGHLPEFFRRASVSALAVTDERGYEAEVDQNGAVLWHMYSHWVLRAASDEGVATVASEQRCRQL